MATATQTAPRQQQAAPTQAAQPGNAVAQQQATDLVRYVPLGQKEEIKLSVNIVQKFLCKPTKSGKLASEADCMKFVMLCRARELDPWQGDAFLVGYDGKDGPEFSLITAHQAFLKRAEVNPDFDGMESGVIVQMGDQVQDREGDFMFEGEILLGAWATVYRKSRRIPVKRRINFKTFCKDNNFWRSNPAGQIVKCSESDALRSAFPATLSGLYIEEEQREPVRVEQVIDEPLQKSPPVGRNRITRTNGKASPATPEADPQLANGNGNAIHDDHPINKPAGQTVLEGIRKAALEQGLGGEDLRGFIVKYAPAAKTLEDMNEEAARGLLCELTGGDEPE